MAATSKRGIVTLADGNYFPGLELLYQSVQETYPVPILCFDIGLTPEQRRYLSGHCPMVDVQRPPGDVVDRIRSRLPGGPVPKEGKRQWPLWICPFLIAASPFRQALWLDCDLIVLRDLHLLFGHIDEGPVFTPENLAPELSPNKPALYELLPIERKFCRERPVINGGVSGWDLERDRGILELYMHPVRMACADPRVRDAISWHDQGALLWAIQKAGLEHRVFDSWEWNLCVRHTRAFERRYVWDRSLFGELRRDVPEAKILHWNGVAFPWRYFEKPAAR